MKLKVMKSFSLESDKFEIEMIPFEIIFNFHMYWCFSSMYICAPHVDLMTSEARTGWGSHLGLELPTAVNHVHLLVFESGSSEPIASALSCWVIPPALENKFWKEQAIHPLFIFGLYFESVMMVVKYNPLYTRFNSLQMILEIF